MYSKVIQLCVHAKSLQLCLTLCDLVDRGPPGSSVHGILQARILEWVAMRSSRGSSDSGIEHPSVMSPALAGRFFTTSTTWEALFSLKRGRSPSQKDWGWDCGELAQLWLTFVSPIPSLIHTFTGSIYILEPDEVLGQGYFNLSRDWGKGEAAAECGPGVKKFAVCFGATFPLWPQFPQSAALSGSNYNIL